MRIDFVGNLVDEPEIKAGFIGCGSHSFRNLFPVFQFAPVDLVATCDLNLDKAQAFARKFGARAAYSSHHEMLEKEDLDAVFICTGYDEQMRPRYPQLAIDCLKAGCHAWIEKPPASSCEEINRMQAAATESGKQVGVGLKKMFFPANEKARELMDHEDFGKAQLVTLQYPQYLPEPEAFAQYFEGKPVRSVRNFLDHLCHPAALMVFLLGMPTSLFYERSANGAGVATFRFPSGVVASLVFTSGSSPAGGMERTCIISEKGRHITVENNRRVTFHRIPGTNYGRTPSYYAGGPEENSAVWEPEFSLGQLYNKGLFLLGYYGEINEFAHAILEERPLAKGTLEQARQVTRLFEAFAEGPGQVIAL